MDGEDFQTIQKGKQGRPVGAGTDRDVLGGINRTIALETIKHPLHKIDSEHYINIIQHMLAGLKNFDPSVEKKLTVQPDLPKIAAAYRKKPVAVEYQKATGDIVFIAFYEFLCIGEYTTKTRNIKKTWTRQFQENDVTLFKLNAEGELRALPRNTSPEEVMLADAATLCISNQNNWHNGACIHRMANMEHPKECPVRDLGGRIVHIRKHLKSGKYFLCLYWDKLGCGSLTDSYMHRAVKYAAG